MGSICCCFPQKTSYRMNEDNYEQQISENDPVNEEEKRLRAAQAAERRMQDQQSRGITNPGGAPLRKAHAELPGNADSNLRWQVS